MKIFNLYTAVLLLLTAVTPCNKNNGTRKPVKQLPAVKSDATIKGYDKRPGRAQAVFIVN